MTTLPRPSVWALGAAVHSHHLHESGFAVLVSFAAGLTTYQLVSDPPPPKSAPPPELDPESLPELLDDEPAS